MKIKLTIIVAVGLAALLAIFLQINRRKTRPEKTVRKSVNTPRASSHHPAQIKPKSGNLMVLIPAGSFRMGSTNGRSDEKPVHTVKLDAFYMDITPITQAQYQALMRENPSKYRNPDNPVEQVRWSDAVRFCNKCSELEGLDCCYVKNDKKQWVLQPKANGYRLPTEAEWEYAARAGTQTTYFFGDKPSRLGSFGWYKRNTPGHKPKPVGKKACNPWRLYDMVGNVNEWTNDWYAPDYYAKSPSVNPYGPESGSKKVLRGGSVKDSAKKCRHAYRLSEVPNYADVCAGFDLYGFRRVRKATASQSQQ